MKSLHSQNFYEILGVSRYAAPEEIRQGYELSKQTFTQDSMATYSLFSEEEHDEILELIGAAYETLLSPELRREYDTFLDSGAPGSHTAWNAWRRPGGERSGESARRTAAPRNAPRPAPKRASGGAAKAEPPPRARQERPAAPSGSAKAAGKERPAAPTEPAAPPESSAPPEPDAASEPARTGGGGGGGTDMVDFASNVEAFDGATLRKARELRGMSLRDVCDQTKIRQTYVEYIEAENFGGLPAAVYVKGFVRLLASTLELPTERVVQDYMDRYGEPAAKP